MYGSVLEQGVLGMTIKPGDWLQSEDAGRRECAWTQGFPPPFWNMWYLSHKEQRWNSEMGIALKRSQGERY